MRISYATTCKNRLHHLRETLPVTLGNIGPDAEVVLLDYDSRDGLADWARSALGGFIASGAVRYVQLAGEASWHMAKAKNVAHLMATGEVVCNLDADNWATAEYAEWLRSVFAGGERRIAHMPRSACGGGFGRVALRTEDFIRVGGYDERFEFWGYDDCDLINRAILAGLQPSAAPASCATFRRHSDDERPIVAGGTKWTGDAIQRELGIASTKEGIWRANREGWGAARVKVNFSSDVQEANAAVAMAERLLQERAAARKLHLAKYRRLAKWGWHGEDTSGFPELLFSTQLRRALEIGGFDGVSANMMLDVLFPHANSEVHVVDPFEPDPTTPEVAPETEAVFAENLRTGRHENQIHLYKGLSAEVLAWMLAADGYWESFDFIYIDGSHRAKDVFIDAVMSWHLLKVGGALCFDDYHWRRDLPATVRPQAAIDAFETVFADSVAQVAIKRKMYRKMRA